MDIDKTKILLIDDDPELLFGPARVLEQAGFAIITALGGEAALDILRTDLPDMILLDRDMPGIDGLEVCRRIKANPAYSDVMVIFFSGVYTLSNAQRTGLEAGADGYIVRPISNKDLVERVESFERSRRQGHLTKE